MASSSRTAVSGLVLVLATSALFLEADARFLLHDSSGYGGGADSHATQINTFGNRLIFDEPLPFDHLHGLWVGDGNQYSAAVWSIFEDETSMPNCSASTNDFSYEHFNAENAQSIMIAGNQAIYVAHHATYPYVVQNYTNNIMGLADNSTGETECIYFRPYVDLRTGDVKVEVINMALYSLNATGYRQYQGLNCQVVGDEMPGCYTSQVARSQTMQPQVQAASIQANPPSPQISIPPGAVVSVDIETYTCRNGECSTLSPKYADEELEE